MPKSLLPLVKVHLFAKPPYVAGPHPWADKFVPRHLSDGFGQFPFVYGDPLAEPIRWLLPYRICMQENSRTILRFPSEFKVVTRMFHPAGISMRRNCCWSITCLIQTDLVCHRGLIIPGLSPNESNAD